MQEEELRDQMRSPLSHHPASREKGIELRRRGHTLMSQIFLLEKKKAFTGGSKGGVATSLGEKGTSPLPSESKKEEEEEEEVAFEFPRTLFFPGKKV